MNGCVASGGAERGVVTVQSTTTVIVTSAALVPISPLSVARGKAPGEGWKGMCEGSSALVPPVFGELVFGRIDAAPTVFLVCFAVFYRGGACEFILEFFDQFFEIGDPRFQLFDAVEGFVCVEADPLGDA